MTPSDNSTHTYRSVGFNGPITELALQTGQVPVDEEPHSFCAIDPNHDVPHTDVAVQDPGTLQDLVMGCTSDDQQMHQNINPMQKNKPLNASAKIPERSAKL